MRLERWVLPPAIAAVLFTTVAIDPPGGARARGLRVEACRTKAVGPLLLRVAVEESRSPNWHAPRAANIEIVSTSGERTRAVAYGVPGAPYAFAAITAVGIPRTVHVSAEGLTANADVPPIEPRTPGGAPIALGADGVDIVTEGGPLVPEVPSAVLVRIDGGANHDIGFLSGDDSLQLEPRRSQLDACGVALFQATLHGLDAHVAVDDPGPPERAVRRRLTVAPGGVSAHVDGPALTLTTSVGGQVVYVLAGDATQPFMWSAVRLQEGNEDNASTHVPLPIQTAWAIASLSPFFDQPVGLWTKTPDRACHTTSLGERFARASIPLPPPPTITLLYDGAARAGQARGARRHRARVAALTLSAVSIALLVALILLAGLSKNPDALGAVSTSARQRLWFSIASAGALLVGGWVLLQAFILRE